MRKRQPKRSSSSSAAGERTQQERDDEFITYLVRMALSQWFKDRGRPDMAEHYARIASEPSVTPSRKRRRKSV